MTPAADGKDGSASTAARGDDEAMVAILDRPDMLTLQQFAERFGMTRALLDKRHAAGKLLGLHRNGKRRFRYPAWQGRLVSDDHSRGQFERILGLFGPKPSWVAYRFFTSPSELLGGRSPVEAWREQSADLLVRAAEEWLDHAGNHSGQPEETK